ncbi:MULTISPECIES: class I SAM-dependent methyltransferase [Marinovum]|uniref:class I SAM-dependent methyltransferase n=1 Tax=Marinovum TaxID=367771 RepID=UPI00237BCD23|nr:class I SAM-dependent methyltransferase [Marinovum sp. PR37]MDD9746545.1 class I SAM-dependent methyltransferase [Marinovum sp. PR37]
MSEDQPERMTPLTLLQEHAVRDSFETFREAMTGAMLFPRKAGLRKYCAKQALATHGARRLYAEFGVWRGHGINLFARMLEPEGGHVTGFDSFEGLEEDWTGHSRGGEAGRYNLDGVLPEVRSNVTLVKGWVQDTVPGWLVQQGETPFALAHFDMDTYTPTAFVLAQIRPRLVAGSVLLFDELYGYPGWRHHEYKALREALPEDSYRFVGFSEQAVAIEMTRAL